jgi:hypothetical protein
MCIYFGDVVLGGGEFKIFNNVLKLGSSNVFSQLLYAFKTCDGNDQYLVSRHVSMERMLDALVESILPR